MAQEKWIMLIPKSSEQQQSLNIDDCTTSIVSFPHPKFQNSVKFLLKESEFKSSLYEINKNYENPSSWLINNEFVKSDGSIFMVTPFDPLFIILSYLYNEKSEKFVLLDQIIPKSNGTVNVGSKLLKCLESELQMSNISDTAGTSNELTAYRYSEHKSLKWLKKKVENTVSALKRTKLFIEEQENISSEDSKLVYACGMVCDYLPNDLATKLKAHLGIKEKLNKRKSASFGPSSKKAKIEPTDDYSKLLHLPKTHSSSTKKSSTRAQKILDKVDKKGMKTMSCYFKAKQKSDN